VTANLDENDGMKVGAVSRTASKTKGVFTMKTVTIFLQPDALDMLGRDTLVLESRVEIMSLDLGQKHARVVMVRVEGEDAEIDAEKIRKAVSSE
jgi:phosphotransferase system HPr-like phosphotransfer protein